MGLIYMLNASPTAIDYDVYQPRNPKASAYYRCVEDHFEQLETVWDDRYQSRFGFIIGTDARWGGEYMPNLHLQIRPVFIPITSRVTIWDFRLRPPSGGIADLWNRYTLSIIMDRIP
jgi:hypothetical protein